MTFEDWVLQLNSQIAITVGLSLADLPQMPFDDWYEAGISPADAAEIAIERVGLFKYSEG